MPDQPFPSATTLILGRDAVTFTSGVPSELGDQDLNNPDPPRSEGTFILSKQDRPQRHERPRLAIAAFATSFALTGPAITGVFAARLDASGIMLPEIGVHVPWTSIGDITAKTTGVRIDIAGPVLLTGTLPTAWERRAATHLQRERGLDLRTDRQEDVLQVAHRHRNVAP